LLYHSINLRRRRFVLARLKIRAAGGQAIKVMKLPPSFLARETTAHSENLVR
jgi:hypothetical protein